MTLDHLRALGPEGLHRFLTQPGALDSPELDALCAQKDARHALLYWFTDFELARAEAHRTGRPMLSLQLLGRLDDELSCANSRFFRTTLYPMREVAAELREHFVLHWHSVRPVPVVKVDFGDGRTLTRTITGNSAHLVLDRHGRPVDCLPGLLTPAAFLKAVRWARALARETDALAPSARTLVLRRRHRQARETNLRAWAVAVKVPQERDPAELERATVDWARLAGPVELDHAPALLERKYPTAEAAGARAMTKLRVEAPLLRALSNLERTYAEDSAKNTHLLHRQIHEHFEAAPPRDWQALSDWVYETIFLMPPEDPWLGLAPDDAWSGLEHGGLSRDERALSGVAQ